MELLREKKVTENKFLMLFRDLTLEQKKECIEYMKEIAKKVVIPTKTPYNKEG